MHWTHVSTTSALENPQKEVTNKINGSKDAICQQKPTQEGHSHKVIGFKLVMVKNSNSSVNKTCIAKANYISNSKLL